MDWSTSRVWEPGVTDGWVLDCINSDGQRCLWAGRPGNLDLWRVRSTSTLMFATEPDTTLAGVRVFDSPDSALEAAAVLDRRRLVDEPAAIRVRKAVEWALGG